MVPTETGIAEAETVKGHDSDFVSILIPTRNSSKYLAMVLDSIFNLDYDRNKLEVIIVDAMSSDATAAIAKSRGCRVIETPGNAPTAYNKAINECRGDLIAFADSDAIVDKLWLQNLVGRLKREDSHIAGVGGLCLTQNRDRVIARLVGYDMDWRFSKIRASHLHFPTMNLLCRKSSIIQIGGFNENLEVGYDVDLGLKLQSEGFQMVYEPTAVVYHWHRDTLKGYARQQFTTGRNVPRLLLDNGMKMSGSRIDPASMYVEPIVLLASIAVVLLGLLTIQTLILVGAIIGSYLPVIYISRTAQIGVLQKRPDVILLPGFYTVRLICWTMGASLFAMSEATRPFARRV